MDAGRPIAEAIAVKDGRIVSVGTLESMRPWLERKPYEIDDSFRDKVIFPGFIDPHTHFRMSGVYMGLTYLGPINQQGPRGFSKGLHTRDDVLDKLREVDRSLADPTDPIIAWGLDPAVQGGQFHRDELDAVSRARPIWTVTYAPHVVVANSPMLKIIDVDESSV
jgi:predicted amidohydrolase YtcJ